MRVTYDQGSDVLEILLGNEDAVADSVDVGAETEGVIAHLDEAGHVIGIEILGAADRYGLEAVRTVAVQLLGEPAPVGS